MQESRFLEGWTPHVSLDSFASTNTARQRLREMTESGLWVDTEVRVPVHAMALFWRNPLDRKLYAVSSVPLSPVSVRASAPSAFVKDWGLSQSCYQMGLSSPVLHEMERVCVDVARDMGCSDARMVTTGSLALFSVLPGISDADAVVELYKKNGSGPLHVVQFQKAVAERLLENHPNSRIRLRRAGTGRSPLQILTAKLWPSAPSMDILVAVLDSDGATYDEASQTTHNSTLDAPAILAASQTAALSEADHSVDTYCRALRFIKAVGVATEHLRSEFPGTWAEEGAGPSFWHAS